MGKKIEIKIEVSNIQDWDVNWDNSSEKNRQISKLKHEIKTVLSDNMGIYWDNINIEKCEVSE